MRQFKLLLVNVVAFGCAFVVPALAEKRVALVIGNSAYQNVARLDNPTNDAKLMANTLRGLGFTLVGGSAQIDLDKAKFDSAVQSFGNQLLGANVALFYYAGHGVQVRGSNYLVPVSANPTREADVDFQMVDVALVLRQMEGSGTMLNLVILDACRNNPFGGRGLRAASGGLAQIRAAAGTLISYATQPGNVAQDGDDGDSPYTKALVTSMREAGRGIFDVFNQVGLMVKARTGGSQQPWLSSSPIDGQFFFVPPGSTVTITTPAEKPKAARLDADTIYWQSIANSTRPAEFQAYLRKFPNGRFSDLARLRAASTAAANAGSEKTGRKDQHAFAPPLVQPKSNDTSPDSAPMPGATASESVSALIGYWCELRDGRPLPFSASIERTQSGIFAENFAPFMHMEVERQGQTVFMGKDSGLYFRVAYKLSGPDRLETTYHPPGREAVNKTYVRCKG